MASYVTGNNIQNPTTFHHLCSFYLCPSHHPSACLTAIASYPVSPLAPFPTLHQQPEWSFRPEIITHHYSIYLEGFSSQILKSEVLTMSYSLLHHPYHHISFLTTFLSFHSSHTGLLWCFLSMEERLCHKASQLNNNVNSNINNKCLL